MKFGIFYELQCPRPWEADTEHKLYQNALSQVELRRIQAAFGHSPADCECERRGEGGGERTPALQGTEPRPTLGAGGEQADEAFPGLARPPRRRVRDLAALRGHGWRL